MPLHPEAFEKGLQYLEKNPEQLQMSSTITPQYKSGTYCGTTCCYAGAVVLAHDPPGLIPTGMRWSFVQMRAMDLLGIDEDQAEELFHTPHWPPSQNDAYYMAHTAKDRVHVLRNVVRDFLKRHTHPERTAES